MNQKNSGKESSEHMTPQHADSVPLFVLFAFFAVKEMNP